MRPGTNFPGWLLRIQRNEFISGLRRERPTVELNDAIAGTLSHAPRQESGIVLREFKRAFRTPAGPQRRALLLAGLAGLHETIAAMTGSRSARSRAGSRAPAPACGEMLEVGGDGFSLPRQGARSGHAAGGA